MVPGGVVAVQLSTFADWSLRDGRKVADPNRGWAGGLRAIIVSLAGF